MLSEVVKEKNKAFWNEDAKKKFTKYDRELMHLQSESTIELNVFFNAFSLLCDRTRLMAKVSQTAITLVTNISKFLEMREKTYALQFDGKLADREEDASDEETEAPVEDVTSFTQQMSALQRSVCYLIG
jgi:hypothetical protein